MGAVNRSRFTAPLVRKAAPAPKLNSTTSRSASSTQVAVQVTQGNDGVSIMLGTLYGMLTRASRREASRPCER